MLRAKSIKLEAAPQTVAKLKQIMVNKSGFTRQHTPLLDKGDIEYIAIAADTECSPLKLLSQWVKDKINAVPAYGSSTFPTNPPRKPYVTHHSHLNYEMGSSSMRQLGPTTSPHPNESSI